MKRTNDFFFFQLFIPKISAHGKYKVDKVRHPKHIQDTT